MNSRVEAFAEGHAKKSRSKGSTPKAIPVPTPEKPDRV